ncbi:TRAP-type C4-dicarboxylate transport system, small permease component [Gemmobacter aquatilis]|uniref:TRAP transporter small permease protein n=1 Tax=Gemmobacter aquatilis TaxID=933059 RepID=A0A1H7Y875_9RHOB|nr:TRAP transporter small permease [Gemmobacter aquatilis]SEM41518.1 TRAP-type C4-dicarboxylate transport system, small permease component [Gemmobacter aquatilis]
MAAPATLTHALLGIAAGSFVLGAGVTVVDVAARWLASANVPGAIEVTAFLIGFGALVSMPVCYAQRNHVTAKLLSEISPNRFARPLGRFGAVVSVIFAGLLLWILGENTLDKIGSPETTRDLGLPMPALMWIVSATFALALVGALAGLWREFAGGPRDV